ncbi:MAG TPA: aminoglycoside phosphotransferase family protein [Ktedonobacterales bacterium]|nr:aminoglycoside phosphotransferase family protein [Ktedonobacterales bacterium]
MEPGTTASPDIPGYFAQFTTEYWGEEGAAWLRDLPALLAQYCARWNLALLPPFPGLTFNFVAPVTRADGSPAVLKAGVPRDEIETEIAALRLCDGAGLVRLLEADAQRGVMLLERALPGEPLSRMEDDDQATAIAADVMRAIWRPAPDSSPFPTVAGWLRAFDRVREMFDGGSGPLPETALARGEALGRDLLTSAPGQSMLLHGDLHHENIVSAQRMPWLVIDPKGVTGDPCFEVGAFLTNPYERFMSWDPREWPARMARRVDILTERLGFPRERIVAWGVTQATLSAVWGVEDGEDNSRLPSRIARADALAALL